jgi:hypothetical protein
MTWRDALRHPVTIAAAVLLVVVGAATATPWRVDIPTWAFGIDLSEVPEMEAPTAAPTPSPPQEPVDNTGNDTVATILIVLAVLAVAALAWFVARKIVAAVKATPRRTITPDPLDAGAGLATEVRPTVPLPELVDAVDRALAHLDDARTPTDGVIAAWVALEDAAAEHGTHRDPAQTSTEFARTVLDATPAPAADVDMLRRLYQRARFTEHTVTDDDVAAARAALVAIARSIQDAHHQEPSP